MGVLQRAFPNSTLRLNSVVGTADEEDVLQLLSCTELRGVKICPTPAPGGRDRQLWQAIASLGRLHGGRLQLVAGPGAFGMLEAEPSLGAHVSQAALPRSIVMGSSLADQVSSLSSLTKLALRNQDSALGESGMLDALRQLSVLQSLCCPGGVMQRLLVNSVPSSWPLLTNLQVIMPAWGLDNNLKWSLVEQQCPQLQALALTNIGIVDDQLCLTALTSLTCHYWLADGTGSIQCSQLGHLVVQGSIDLVALPSTLTSLFVCKLSRFLVHPPDLHLRGQQSLVHICFTSHLVALSDIQDLVSTTHPLLSTFVTSVQLTMHPKAFVLPDMDGSMAGQHFHHLWAWFPHLQRLHIHLCAHARQQAKEVLISAAWLPAHCRLVVTHKLTCPVHIMKNPPGCLSLSLSSCPAHD